MGEGGKSWDREALEPQAWQGEASWPLGAWERGGKVGIERRWNRRPGKEKPRGRWGHGRGGEKLGSRGAGTAGLARRSLMAAGGMGEGGKSWDREALEPQAWQGEASWPLGAWE